MRALYGFFRERYTTLESALVSFGCPWCPRSGLPACRDVKSGGFFTPERSMLYIDCASYLKLFTSALHLTLLARFLLFTLLLRMK